MMTILIETACTTAAEAHQLGEGITCALDGARVVRAYERIFLGEASRVVTIAFPEEHWAHVCGLLETDDRVMAYSFDLV